MTRRERNPRKPYVVERPEQRRALASPIRMEILGQFTSPDGLSIAEVAERMARPATALYYHFGILERTGLLIRVGERPAGKRMEAVFEPVAARIELGAEAGSDDGLRTAMKTTAAAFRMAERDMKAGLTEGTARSDGADRNFFAARMHCRVTGKTLAEINRHLDAIIDIVERECRGATPAEGNEEYCSVTLALLPLRGRRARPTPTNPKEPK